MSGKPSITQLQYPNKSGMSLKIILFSVAVIAVIGMIVYTLMKSGGEITLPWTYVEGDRAGGDVFGECAKEKNQEDLQAKCKANPDCVGYTLFYTRDNPDTKQYWKPWCMKTASSAPFAANKNVRFFPKPSS